MVSADVGRRVIINIGDWNLPRRRARRGHFWLMTNMSEVLDRRIVDRMSCYGLPLYGP